MSAICQLTIVSTLNVSSTLIIFNIIWMTEDVTHNSQYVIMAQHFDKRRTNILHTATVAVLLTHFFLNITGVILWPTFMQLQLPSLSKSPTTVCTAVVIAAAWCWVLALPMDFIWFAISKWQLTQKTDPDTRVYKFQQHSATDANYCGRFFVDSIQYKIHSILHKKWKESSRNENETKTNQCVSSAQLWVNCGW